MEEAATWQNATDLTQNVKMLCKVSLACKKSGWTENEFGLV